MRLDRSLKLVLPAVLAAVSLTCSGDSLTRPSTEEPAGNEPSALVVSDGPPASVQITRQPPSTALDREVWAPGTQPSVTVKDAAGVLVAGAVVTVAVASGPGTLQGALSATTKANGTAQFTDLGIAGTGAHTLQFTAGTATRTSGTVNLSALPVEASTGRWDAPVAWDIVPLHINLLPTGRVLAWGKLEADGSMGMPRLWNPAAGSPAGAPIVAADTMLFCSGHALMADGKVMVSGGHKADDRGLDVTHIFDPVSQTWNGNLPKMAKGRWYPTVTELPDGRMVTVAGRDTTSSIVLVPEIWENNSWVRLPGASFSFPYYPRDFVAPNGKIFYAGERVKSRYLDVDATTTNGRGKWSTAAGFTHVWPFNRDYGSAVMYEPGKVLYVGGGGYTTWGSPDPKAAAPTATAETINLTATGPHWVSTDPMHFGRRHLNATLLPDGQILVTGGTSAGGFNTLSGAVHAAEVWNPATGHWTQLASNTVDRAYHSVSLLLPDGTVLHGASGDATAPGTGELYPRQRNHEIFRPPYLFKGARPTITSLSQATVAYGAKFTITTPFASQITQVRWIRLGSVTHAFDASQRANTLTFTRTTTALKVTAPTSGRLAPPGHYLVFVLNRNGVPSAGAVIKVQ
jgi:galactose oxidase